MVGDHPLKRKKFNSKLIKETNPKKQVLGKSFFSKYSYPKTNCLLRLGFSVNKKNSNMRQKNSFLNIYGYVTAFLKSEPSFKWGQLSDLVTYC